MPDSNQPDEDDSGIDGELFKRFELAWMEEPSRILTPEEICEGHSNLLSRVRDMYPEWVMQLKQADVRFLLRRAIEDKVPPDWELIRSRFPELDSWAHSEYAAMRAEIESFRTVSISESELLSQARESLPLGHIRLDRVAGRGGFGVVFEGRDLQLDRAVAVKKVLPHNLGFPDIQKRLKREAMIAARLEHPGIVPVYTLLGRDDESGESGFVMRLLPTISTPAERHIGESDKREAESKKVVRHLLDEINEFHVVEDSWDATDDRKQKFRRLLQRFVDVCHAISFAHSRLIVHCDLKPGNIVIGRHGETLVCDWGICRVLLDEAETLSMYSAISEGVDQLGGLYNADGLGTEGYASPEQEFRSPEQKGWQGLSNRVRQPADVFSLGAVLYCILTGRSPNGRLDANERFQTFPEWVPVQLIEIVRKATSPSPTNRYIAPHEARWFLTPEKKPDPNVDQLPGGVDELRQAVQDWLDGTNPVQVALDETKSELSQTLTELNEKKRVWERARRSAFVATVVFVGIIVGLAAWASFILKPRVEKLAQESAGYGSEVEQLRKQLQGASSTLERTQIQLKKVESETASAVTSRNSVMLDQSLALIHDRQLLRAKEILESAAPAPNLFAWNYAYQSTQTKLPIKFSGVPSGLAAHQGDVLAINVSSDGRWMMSFGEDGRLLKWDLTQPKPVSEYFIGPPPAKSVVSSWQKLQAFSPDGKWLAAAGTVSESSLTVWLVETETGTVRKEWSLNATSPDGSADLALMSLSFSGDSRQLLMAGAFPDKNFLGVATSVHKASVIDLTGPDFTVIAEHCPATSSPYGWVLSADGRSVYGFGLGTSLPFGSWDLPMSGESGSEAAFVNLGEMSDDVSTIPFNSLESPDGRFLVMAGNDKAVQVYVERGMRRTLSLGNPCRTRAIAISDDGRLAAMSEDSLIRVYDTVNWRVISELKLESPAEQVNAKTSLEISPDHQSLYVARFDGISQFFLSSTRDYPIDTSLGNLTHVSAARWMPNGDLWIAQSGNPSGETSANPSVGQIAVTKVRPDGSVVQTLVDGIGMQTPPGAMSHDGSRVFVGRQDSQWSTSGRVECWGLRPEPHKLWSHKEAGTEIRVIGETADGTVWAESVFNRFGYASDRLIPSKLIMLRNAGQEVQYSFPGDSTAWKMGHQRQAVFLKPRPIDSIKSGHRPASSISVGIPGRPREVEIQGQAINAAISDDGAHIAAVVLQEGQVSGTTGTLKVFRTPDMEEVATLDDYPIAMPFDYGLAFSPDGQSVAVGTQMKNILVWMFAANQVTHNISFSPQDWRMPWITGVTFTPDGQRLIMTAYDQFDFHNPNRIGRSTGDRPGILAMIDLNEPEAEAKAIRTDLGWIAMGAASADRCRVPTTNIVTAETRVWDLSNEVPQEVARIPNENAGFFDSRWSELNSVRSLAVSPDESFLAIGGTLHAKKGVRVLLFDVASRRVLRSVELDSQDLFDIAWVNGELRILSSERAKDGGLDLVLSQWEIDEPKTNEVARYANLSLKELIEAGAMLHPRFAPDGQRFAMPAKDPETKAQFVRIHSAIDGSIESTPTTPPVELLHAFAWTPGQQLLQSMVSLPENQRKIIVWDFAIEVRDTVYTEEIARIPNGFAYDALFHVAMSPDGDSIVMQRWGSNTLEVVSLGQKRRSAGIRHAKPSTPGQLLFSPSGDALLMTERQLGATILHAPRPNHSETADTGQPGE